MALRLNLAEWQKKWMGKQVEYTEVFKRTFLEKDKREYVEWIKQQLDCPLRGWAMGTRWLLTGYIIRPHFSRGIFEGGDDYEPGCLREDQPRTLCYLVVPYPTRNYIRVPPESVKLIEE